MCFLTMAVGIEIGWFLQPDTVQEKVRESDLVSLWDAPQGVVHLLNASFRRVHKCALVSLGVLVQRQLLSCTHQLLEFDTSGYG